MLNQLNENARLNVELLKHLDSIKSIVGRESMNTLYKSSDIFNPLLRSKGGENTANHGFERKDSKSGDETFTVVLARRMHGVMLKTYEMTLRHPAS